MKRDMTKVEGREVVLDCLRTLQEHIGGAWPLSEAFTDLDDHPEEDQDPGFNYNVGYVNGLCEGFGLDLTALCAEVEPNPPSVGENKEDKEDPC